MQRPPALLGLAVAVLCGCASARSRLELATLDGVHVASRPIQGDVQVHHCETRLLSLIPVSGLGRATPASTLRHALTEFPDGNALSDVDIAADHRNVLGLLDRHCWTVRGDVTVVE